MKKNKKVYLRWIDSSLLAEWAEAPSDKTGVAVIDTIGYLIYEDKDHVEVAQNVTESHKCAVMSIPKSVILKRKELKVKK